MLPSTHIESTPPDLTGAAREALGLLEHMSDHVGPMMSEPVPHSHTHPADEEQVRAWRQVLAGRMESIPVHGFPDQLETVSSDPFRVAPEITPR